MNGKWGWVGILSHPSQRTPAHLMWPHLTSLKVGNCPGDHFPWQWKENACLLFRSNKLKFFLPSRTNTASLCWLGHFREFYVDYLYSIVAGQILQSYKIKNFFPETSRRKVLKILVTVLLVSFKQRSSMMTIDTRVKHTFHLLTLYHNGMIERSDFEKQWYLVKFRFLLLISRKSVINLKLEPFGEVCRGCPLQLCRLTSYAKIKNKKNILWKIKQKYI